MALRVLEAFSGVGSQRMALRNLGIEHEIVAIAEIDKFAIASYEAIHGETYNLGDISQVELEDIPDQDLFTYSFPCQDISVAGKGLGLDEGSGTRSGLLWECQKIIAGKKPKYLLLENVKALVGKRHKPNFDKWLEWLEDQGYTNYWKVLNAKDYGIPQNRERVFVVSILGEHEPYEFPEPIELELSLKDVLEDEVDEKFYLDTDKSKKLIATVEAVPTEVVIGASRGRNPENPSDRDTGSPTEQRLEINKQGTSNTITTVQKDNYVVEGISDKFSFVKRKSREIIAEKGSLPKYYNPYNKSEVLDIAPTITTNSDRASNSGQVMINNNFRIRKLTPKECWRLMGFSDDDFHKAEEVNSNAQLYKQAGNSIVVGVLEGIFRQLFKKVL